MRCIVKTNDDQLWAKKLKRFNADLDKNGTLTVDLNSWHAFVTLQRTFDYAPVVDSLSNVEISKSISRRPIVDFRHRGKS